jgi:hypothetical protein
MLVVALPSVGMCANIETYLGKSELTLGQLAKIELLKECKLSTSAIDLARVQAIGSKIADIANKVEIKAIYGNSRITPFQYTFDIIEDEEISAYSLPGGFVYVSSGLIKFVQSDDELAAAIAHAITHSSHHHMIYIMQKPTVIPDLIGDYFWMWDMLIEGKAKGVYNPMLAPHLYTVARIDRYDRDVECDADSGTVQYLIKAGYNPVGLLTYIERFTQFQKKYGQDMGIYPQSLERQCNVKRLLNDFHIPIERWKTTKLAKIEVREAPKVDPPLVYIAINGALLFRVTASGDLSALQRARKLADKLEEAFKSELHVYDIKADTSGALYIKKECIFSATEADATNMKKSQAQIAEDAANSIRYVIWKNMLDTIH